MNFTFKIARRLAQSHIIGVLALGFLAGSCAPGKPLESGLEPPPDDVLAIHLVPDSVSLNPTEYVDFSAIAELNGGGNGRVAVDWEAAGGTITADGRYTAGTTSGTYKVKGRYRNGKVDSAVVAINPLAPAPVLTRINVTPITAALQPGTTQQFLAFGVMSDGSGTAVTVAWAATGGTVTGSGFYTAPSGAGTYLVIATEQTGTLADTAQITVGAPPPTLAAVILTPITASLEFGRTQQFAAVGQLSDGSSTSIPITWTATGGTINAGGLYTAGNTAGNFRVIARSANGLADTSSVTVTAPTITAITLTPATASLQSGQTQQFSVSATLSNGSTQANPSVTWVATGGAVNGSGLYIAGATAGGFRVIATSANGRADTSAVTVTTPTVTAITVTPATVSLSPAQTQQFTASATLSNGATQANPSVTWSGTGGTISTGGLYTAGSTAGSFRVIAASANGRADTSTVTISVAAPTISSITVTPATTTLLAGQTQQFSASASMSDGSTQANPSVTWSATGGTVSTVGLYTAGTSAGAFRVIAASSNGHADTSAVTVTVSAVTVTAITVTPATATLASAATQQFTASATMSDGSTQASPTVTWSATGGTVTTAGLYTAGSTAGAFRVIAASANGLADTSAITITAATIVSVSLTPATVALQTGQTQQFSVSATLSSGGTQNNPAVTYSVTGGTITTGGLYTAGGTAGSFRVIATATGGAADTSAVTLTAATVIAITVTPASATVATGQTAQFSASATLSNGGTQANPSVTWSATGGTISTGGLYTAGTTAGSFRVIAVQQGGTLADTSVGTITAPGAFNPYANRPANYTVVQSDYAFSTGIPVSINAPVADGSGWIANYNTDGWMYRGTDATAPISPPNVLEWSYVAGQGTPTSSAGFGHLYLPVDPAIKSWYASFAIWHDANFEWNAVGNKLFEWFTYNQNGIGVAILNSRNGPGDFMSWILENVPTTTLYSRTTAFGNSLSDAYFDGHWVNVELQYKSSTPGNNDGELRVWVARSDGSDGPVGKLTLQYTGLQLPGAVGESELNLNSTWGGGSGPTTRNSIRRIDHILLAHP